jgi:hypothetical protein
MKKVDKVLNQILGIPEKDWLSVYNTACKSGRDALDKVTPVPMVVQQHKNILNDNSPVTKEWYIEGGVCGFAWVSINIRKGKSNKGTTRDFITAMKKSGIVGDIKDGCSITYSDYEKGYLFFVHDGGQSLQRKEAYAQAAAEVLRNNGINAYSRSRMD